MVLVVLVIYATVVVPVLVVAYVRAMASAAEPFVMCIAVGWMIVAMGAAYVQMQPDACEKDAIRPLSSLYVVHATKDSLVPIV
jgi:hypothetical protein